MTLEETLAAMADFPIMEPADFVKRRLVVIAPHPDDESLGCGGLIAGCRAAGLPVAVVIVSDGAASHPRSRRFAAPRLAALRREEALEAVGRLGVAARDVHFLDLPDSAVPTQGRAAAEAIERLAALVSGADVVTVTWRHDPHCDHQASFALARQACACVAGVRLWEYPIWGLTLPPDTELGGHRPRGVRVRIAAHQAAKRHALAAHASQMSGLIADDPEGFTLTPDMIARFDSPHEVYIEAAS